MAFQPVGQVGFAAGFAEMAGGQRLMRGSVAQQSVLPFLRLCGHAGLLPPSENVHTHQLETVPVQLNTGIANFTLCNSCRTYASYGTCPLRTVLSPFLVPV